jgi:hypothetical protein
VIGKNSQLSPESDLVTINITYGAKPIELRSVYEEDGHPRFYWDEVPNALSYQYRYENEYILHCTTETNFKIPTQPVEPRWFSVSAYDGADCQGSVLAKNEGAFFVPLPPKLPKPTGITVKYVSYDSVEFDVPNRNPNSYWRVYRSDGLMMRIFPQMSFRIGMQANEDLNGKTFSYRFAEMVQTTWADSWSELSDPIQVTLPSPDKIAANCFKRPKSAQVRCTIPGHRDAQKIRIEYLDSAQQVISYKEVNNNGSAFAQVLPVEGAVYVRTSATYGTEKTRNSWYRRGEGTITEIAQANFTKFTHQIR